MSQVCCSQWYSAGERQTNGISWCIDLVGDAGLGISPAVINVIISMLYFVFLFHILSCPNDIVFFLPFLSVSVSPVTVF